MVGLDVTAVYTSPILRARATAAVMAARVGVDVVVLDDLREFDLGGWEGRPGTDQDVRDHPVFAGWLAGRGLGQRFEGGESAEDLRDRLQHALARALEEHPEGTVVMVTHGGLLAVAVPLVAMLGEREWPGIPANCQGCVVRSADGAAARQGAPLLAPARKFVLEG